MLSTGLQVCNCVVNGPSVFFTDPSCGLQQNFRTDAQLGEYVWRWDIRTGSVQVAADGFVQVRLCMQPRSTAFTQRVMKAEGADFLHSCALECKPASVHASMGRKSESCSHGMPVTVTLGLAPDLTETQSREKDAISRGPPL